MVFKCYRTILEGVKTFVAEMNEVSIAVNEPDYLRVMKKSMLSVILVIIQFGAIAFYLLSGPIFSGQLVFLIMQFLAFAIAFWGILAMGITKVSVFPTPTASALLVVKGPYRIIRHPMYTGIVLMAGAMLAGYYTHLRLVVFLILCANQIIKLLWEEKMMIEKIPAYKEYMVRTWRLLPFVF